MNRPTNRRRIPLPGRWLATCLLLLACASAYAETANRDLPINIEADRLTVDDAKKISTYEGNVVLTQGTLLIRGDKLVVRQGADGFNHGTVYGNPASFRQKQEGADQYVNGYADRIEYDSRAGKAELFGHAHLKRGGDEVRGNYISYDAKSEFYKVIGAGKGADKGRVHAIIQPKSKPGAQAAPGPAEPGNKAAPR